MKAGDPLDGPEVRWGVGWLLGGVAVGGTLILVLLVAIALNPPTWVQVLLAVGLTLGGGMLSWLIATSLAESRSQRQRSEWGARSERQRPGTERRRAERRRGGA